MAFVSRVGATKTAPRHVVIRVRAASQRLLRSARSLNQGDRFHAVTWLQLQAPIYTSNENHMALNYRGAVFSIFLSIVCAAFIAKT